MLRRLSQTLLASLATAAVTALTASAAHAIGVTTVDLDSLDGTALKGVLYTPNDWNDAVPKKHRAVVMLHGCTGIWSNRDPSALNADGSPNLQNHIEKWGRKLAAQGYVALAVDSYTPREPASVDDTVLAQRQAWQDQCADGANPGKVDPYTTRVDDAEGAYDFLVYTYASRVDDLRVGLLGWSQGAESAMVEVADSWPGQSFSLRPTSDLRFSTTVTFYPGCGPKLGDPDLGGPMVGGFGAPSTGFWHPYTEFRMNAGTLDDLFADETLRMRRAMSLPLVAGQVSSVISNAPYKLADHSFDNVSQTWPATSCVGTGDLCAMQNADIASLAFFDMYL